MVLKRMLTVKLLIVSFSFSFVPFILCAIMLGRKYAMLIGIIGDILGVLMFPRGAFFPGYTLSAMLTGYIYGAFLYKEGDIKVDKMFLLKLILSVSLVGIFINFGLNSVWLYYITKKAIKVIVPIKPFKVKISKGLITWISVKYLIKSISIPIKTYIII